MSPNIQWLTTVPNPHVRGYGPDDGQRGWRLHAVEADGSETSGQLRWKRALCGLWPGHGWGVDLFIDEPCIRCVKRARKLGIEVPKDMIQTVERREDMRHRLRAGEFNYPSGKG